MVWWMCRPERRLKQALLCRCGVWICREDFAPSNARPSVAPPEIAAFLRPRSHRRNTGVWRLNRSLSIRLGFGSEGDTGERKDELGKGARGTVGIISGRAG